MNASDNRFYRDRGDEFTEGGNPFLIVPYRNGGFAIQKSGRSMGYEGEPIASFTNAVDMIEWLAENLIKGEVPGQGLSIAVAP